MNTNWLSRFISPFSDRLKTNGNTGRNKIKHVLAVTAIAAGFGTNSYAISGPTTNDSGNFTLTYAAGMPGMMNSKNAKIEIYKNGTFERNVNIPALSSSHEIDVNSTGTYRFDHYTKRMTCLQWFHPRTRGCAEPGEFIISYAGQHTVEVTSVPQPASLTYSSTYLTGNFTLNWGASSGAERYVLERKIGLYGPWTELQANSNRSYNESGLAPMLTQYRVSACKGNICSSPKLGSAFIVVEKPSLPSVTVPSYSSSSSATINWAMGSGGGRVDRYEVDFSKDGGTWTDLYNGTATSRPISSLSHKSTYRFRVRACNVQCTDYREGSNSLYVEYKPGKPQLSSNLSGPSTNGAYTISWSVNDNYATQYRLTENGSAEYTGTALSRGIVNHVNGTYAYVVSACNSRNVCTSSDPLNAVVNIALPTPGGLSASPNPVFNGDRTTLTWNAISGNHPIYYELNTPQNTKINKGSSRSHVLEDLAKGSHVYGVRACSSVNSGVCSSLNNITITSDYIVGAPPLTAPSRAYQGYQVSWPVSGNAVEYELQLSTNGSSFTTVQKSAARSFNYSVTRSNHAYGQHRYQVRARNAAGWSNYGSIVTVYNTSLVSGLSASKNPSYNGEAVQLNWTSVPGNISYQVRTPSGSFVNASGNNSHAISGLSAGNHPYGVRACTTASMSQCSPVVELTLTSIYRPAMPQNFSASYPGNYSTGSYSLSWSLVSGATSYELTRSINGGSFTAVSGYNGTANNFSYTPSSSHVNGVHVYRLRARNAAGYSDAAGPVSIVVIPPVTGLSANPNFVRNGEASTLSWNAATGQPISYKLSQSGQSDRVLGNVASHSVANLPFGEHTFTVKACYSNNIALCTPGKSVTIESLYRPTQPAVPSAPASSNGNYRVSWSAINGADSYTLERSINGGSWTVVANGSGLAYDYQVGAAHQDGSHRYRLTATNEAGDSDPSDVRTVIVVSPVNNLNADPQTTLNDQGATLSWQARTGWPIDFFLRLPNGTELDLGGSNSYQLNNLTHGNRQYGVKACSSVNNAICSPLATISIRTIVTPGKPTVLNVPANVDPSDSGYDVTWSEVARADTYILQQAINNDSFVTVYQGAGRSYSVNFADLDNPYGEHRYRLLAANQAGQSAYSDVQRVQLEVDPTDIIRKTLYYNEADAISPSEEVPELNLFSRDLAAFRYMDLSYVLDPETNQVIYQYGEGTNDMDFAELYGDAERSRIDSTRSLILEQLALFPGNSNIERFLLDVYFDQAVAEVMAGNQIMDQARIARLRDSDIGLEIELYKLAEEHFGSALDTFQNLFDQHAGIITYYAATRGDISPRYRDSNDFAQNVTSDDRLYQGFKDVRVYYELMTKWLESARLAIHLEVIGGQTNETLLEQLKVLADNIAIDVNNRDEAMRILFNDIDFANVPGFNGLTPAYLRYQSAYQDILDLRVSLDGDTNLLGFPKDAVLIFYGQQNNGQNQETDTFDLLIQRHNPQTGSLQNAIDDLQKANTDFDSLQINQDNLVTDFEDRLRTINTRLGELIGIEIDTNCSEGLCIISTDSARAGSAISLQKANIENAQAMIELRQQEMENALSTIEIEIERRGAESGIEDAIEEVRLRYDNEQIRISERITEIRIAAERSRRRSSMISGITSAVASAVTGNWAGAVAGLANTASTVRSHNINMKEIRRIGHLDTLSQRLASEERVQVTDLSRQILDINSQALIKGYWLRVKTAEMEIAIAEANADAEIERLIGMIAQVGRLLHEANELRTNQMSRYFADPIHLSRASASLLAAETSFDKAQQWMFYAVQALEYKWQEKFKSTEGLDAGSLFAMRNAVELEDFYDALVEFNDERLLRNFEESTDVVSLKEDVLGYYQSIRGRLQCYDHPFPERRDDIDWMIQDPFLPNECEWEGDGSKLDANYAFRAYLAGNMQTQVGQFVEDWISVDFGTLKPVARSRLFMGPRLIVRGDNSCIVNGGSYNDKIIEMGVNLNTQFGSYETQTNARLTYGGSSYFRAKHFDGIGDVEAALDRIEAIAPQFWDVSGASTLSYQNKLTVDITTPITDGVSGQIIDGTFAFKERSVAASDWRLELLQADDFGPLYELYDISDIELVIRHKYISRNIDTCSQARSTFDTSMQARSLKSDSLSPVLEMIETKKAKSFEDALMPYDYLPEEALFLEELIHRESQK